MCSVFKCVGIKLMGLENNSNHSALKFVDVVDVVDVADATSGADAASEIGVNDYFDSPIRNHSAVKCFGASDVVESSGCDSDLQKYLSEKSISEMIQINSEISRILSKFKISIKINMGVLDNLIRHHLPETKKIALGIADKLPSYLKSKVNRDALFKATSLHDIAKVIMPENIINKAGKLTDSEREIMKEHSVLSYEMLKTTDLDNETLNLIKNHHQNPQKSGYPKADANFVSDVNLQILSMSDIYSALREKRSYKNSMTKEQALSVIKKETDNGKFHPVIYGALVDYANSTECSAKSNSQRQIFNFKPVNSFSS